jgi:hypothetical protein
MIDPFLIGSPPTAGRTMPGQGIDGICFGVYACDNKHYAITICFRV